MPQSSAGILLFRRRRRDTEVLLVHPGGPFWRNKDDGAWSIPKGLYEPAEEPLAAAKREFLEETGCKVDGAAIELGTFRQPSGKRIIAFAIEGDFDLGDFRSNTFSMEWPPKSGRMQDFPEADRAGWFDLKEAARKLLKGQVPILRTLAAKLAPRD